MFFAIFLTTNFIQKLIFEINNPKYFNAYISAASFRICTDDV